jgi:integrase
MVAFSINTGLRSSDVPGLLRVEGDIEQKRIKPIVKKNRKPLSIPLNDAAFAIIEAQYAVRNGPYVSP